MFSGETDWETISKTDPSLNLLKKATRSDDLSQDAMDDIKRIFPQELMEVLEFKDYKKVLFEHLKNPEFQKLLKERFLAYEIAHNR